MDQGHVRPIAISVAKAADTLGLGITKTKELVASNRIASIRVGRRVLIPLKALEAFLVEEQAGG